MYLLVELQASIFSSFQLGNLIFIYLLDIKFYFPAYTEPQKL